MKVAGRRWFLPKVRRGVWVLTGRQVQHMIAPQGALILAPQHNRHPVTEKIEYNSGTTSGEGHSTRHAHSARRASGGSSDSIVPRPPQGVCIGMGKRIGESEQMWAAERTEAAETREIMGMRGRAYCGGVRQGCTTAKQGVGTT